jgi:hypothetical protein
MSDDDTRGDDAPTAEMNHNVNESYDKVRLKTQVKRGGGTRDQDTHDIKVRGETPEAAAENLSEALAELEARDVFKRTREMGDDD